MKKIELWAEARVNEHIARIFSSIDVLIMYWNRFLFYGKELHGCHIKSLVSIPLSFSPYIKKHASINNDLLTLACFINKQYRLLL